MLRAALMRRRGSATVDGGSHIRGLGAAWRLRACGRLTERVTASRQHKTPGQALGPAGALSREGRAGVSVRVGAAQFGSNI